MMTKSYLLGKRWLLLDYYGGLRCGELLALDFDDVTITEECINVFIRSSKTDPKGKSNFYFPIQKNNNDSTYSIIEMYINAVAIEKGKIVSKLQCEIEVIFWPSNGPQHYWCCAKVYRQFTWVWKIRINSLAIAFVDPPPLHLPIQEPL